MVATWALVVATTFLAVAAGIPLARDMADRRARQLLVGANLVPDVNLLRSRLESCSYRLADVEAVTRCDLKEAGDQLEEDLQILDGCVIQSSERPSLEFVSETYIARHFLTQAKLELSGALSLENSDDRDGVRRRDEAIRRARRCYKGAEMSLAAAEGLLAHEVRTIHGEGFWDRFARVTAERETEAERSFVGSRADRQRLDRS